MLNVHSQQFERGAKRVKNKFWWKNVKVIFFGLDQLIFFLKMI
jgi:hypothetical protein